MNETHMSPSSYRVSFMQSLSPFTLPEDSDLVGEFAPFSPKQFLNDYGTTWISKASIELDIFSEDKTDIFTRMKLCACNREFDEWRVILESRWPGKWEEESHETVFFSQFTPNLNPRQKIEVIDFASRRQAYANLATSVWKEFSMKNSKYSIIPLDRYCIEKESKKLSKKTQEKHEYSIVLEKFLRKFTMGSCKVDIDICATGDVVQINDLSYKKYLVTARLKQVIIAQVMALGQNMSEALRLSKNDVYKSVFLNIARNMTKEEDIIHSLRYLPSCLPHLL